MKDRTSIMRLVNSRPEAIEMVFEPEATSLPLGPTEEVELHYIGDDQLPPVVELQEGRLVVHAFVTSAYRLAPQGKVKIW
jgi:hypothetical protein